MDVRCLVKPKKNSSSLGFFLNELEKKPDWTGGLYRFSNGPAPAGKLRRGGAVNFNGTLNLIP